MENKIIILVGKSAVGKGAIENSLVNNGYRRIVTNTTRPPREHEKDGIDYHFCTKEQFNNLIMSGRMIEYRTYNTVHGIWYYGTSDSHIFLDDNKGDYVITLTLDGAEAFVRHFGAENCIIFYIDCPKRIREDRAKKRGSFNQAEWNRRLITDDQDFTSEKVAKVCNFKVANYNKKLYNVVKEIESDIKIWKS